MATPEDRETARVVRLLHWVGWALIAVAVAWVCAGAAMIVWTIRHPAGVALVAALVGNGLVWMVLAISMHRTVLRSFHRERALHVLLRYQDRRAE